MSKRTTIGFIRHFLRTYPYRSSAMVGLLVLAGFADGIGVMTLLPLIQTIQGGSGHGALSRLVAAMLGTLGIAPTLPALLLLIVMAITVKAVLLWLAMKQVGYTIAQIAFDLRFRLMNALLRARWGHFTSRPKGHMANAIGSETQRAVAAYRESCTLLATLIQIVIYGGIALTVSWRATVFAVVAGALFLVLLKRFVGMSRSAGQQQTRIMKSLTARLMDMLQGVKPVKAMALEDRLQPILSHETAALRDAQQQQVLASESLKLFHEPMAAIILAVGLLGMIELGKQPFSAVLVMAFLFYRELQQINDFQMRYQTVANGESAFWSLQDEIAEAEADLEQSVGQLPPPLDTGIELDDVSFTYGQRPVLTHTKLTIPAGGFVAIVGPSGAGKTTIADLILGLYEPTAGIVRVDGVNLADVDLRAWRSKVGYVPQETLLFNDTILNNVTLGDPSIPPAQVEWALRAAGGWDFVRDRSGGVNAPIGEAGAAFSGGQRQRISIARALVRHPRLLILDEATTALDPATERAIGETLEALRGELTIVAISHQPALREAADIVYEVSAGRVRRVGEPAAPALAPSAPGMVGGAS